VKDEEIEVSTLSNGAYHLQVRCPKCLLLVRATGLPVFMPYTSDTGRLKLAQGLMCVRPDPAHDAVCLPLEAAP
jgi:hypothetical protein